ncbi:MAG: PP2C family protein-serine/threonine phosphatase [Eubacteriales bacterium]
MFNFIKNIDMNIIIWVLLIQVIIIAILIIMILKIKNKNNKSTKFFETEKLEFKSSMDLHIGKRNNQEDAISFSDKYKEKMNVDLIGVLCDGMGGIEKGEIASSMAVKEIKGLLSNVKETHIEKEIEAALIQISNKIYDLSLKSSVPGGIGTTIIVIVIKNGKLYWSSIGDSRLYLYRQNKLTLINEEHNYLNSLLEKVLLEKITREEAFNDKDREKLTSYLGQKNINKIDSCTNPLKLRYKDVLLMCSDGVYGTLKDKEIKDILDLTPIEKVSEHCIKAVNQHNKPHQDNMSVVAVEYLN